MTAAIATELLHAASAAVGVVGEQDEAAVVLSRSPLSAASVAATSRQVGALLTGVAHDMVSTGVPGGAASRLLMYLTTCLMGDSLPPGKGGG